MHNIILDADKPLQYENNKPVFFARALRTTDNHFVLWVYRVNSGEIRWTRIFGKQIKGNTSIVYLDNPEKIKEQTILNIVGSWIKSYLDDGNK